MRAGAFTLLVAALSLSSLGAAERTWTSSDGKTFRGIFLSADSDSVRIQRSSDRRQFEVPLSQLSAGDRQFVKMEAATKFLRLDVDLVKSDSQRKSRVTGTRTIRQKQSNGRYTTKKVNITEKYTITGKTLKVAASTTSMPIEADLEVIFVSRNGKSKKVFDSASRQITIGAAGEPMEFKSSLEEHYYGWAVAVKHRGSGKLLAVEASSYPLEQFAREEFGG